MHNGHNRVRVGGLDFNNSTRRANVDPGEILQQRA